MQLRNCIKASLVKIKTVLSLANSVRLKIIKKNPKRWKYYEEKFSALPFVYIKKFVVNTPMGNASSHFMAFPAFLRSEPVIGVNAARPTC